MTRSVWGGHQSPDREYEFGKIFDMSEHICKSYDVGPAIKLAKPCCRFAREVVIYEFVAATSRIVTCIRRFNPESLGAFLFEQIEQRSIIAPDIQYGFPCQRTELSFAGTYTNGLKGRPLPMCEL